MNHKPLLRLLIVAQTFLLFAVICTPLLIQYLRQTGGKLAYGCMTALCIGLAILLRRALTELDR